MLTVYTKTAQTTPKCKDGREEISASFVNWLQG